MKILHLVSSLNPGGVEKWLSDIVEVDEVNQNHFLKQSEREGFLEKNIISNKGNIHFIEMNRKLFYAVKFFAFLKSNKFDVVHSHVHLSSGWLMFICFLANVKIRVTHSHLDDSQNHNGLYFFYVFLMRVMIQLFSNKFIACSKDAAICLFGNDSSAFICPCGVKLNSDHDITYELKENKPVRFCHVGRFSDQKNHKFLISVFSKLLKRGLDAHLSLVGSGERLDYFDKLVSEEGLSNSVTFVGNTEQVDSILVNSDIFLFPSLFEGLGLALIEAQYYGLFCICSSSIPSEAIYGNCKRLDIDETSVDDWVDYIFWLLKETPCQLKDVSAEILNSNVNITNNVIALRRFYAK